MVRYIADSLIGSMLGFREGKGKRRVKNNRYTSQRRESREVSMTELELEAQRER